MSGVFVSHSSKDKAWIEEHVIPVIQSAGLDEWFSHRDIETTERWSKELELGLAQCPIFLVVLSQDAVASGWVEAEVSWAYRHRTEYIVGVFASMCDPDRLHFRLGGEQLIDFTQDRLLAKTRLFEALQRLAGPVAVSDNPHWSDDEVGLELEEEVELGGGPSPVPSVAPRWTREPTEDDVRATFRLAPLKRSDAASLGSRIVHALRSDVRAPAATAFTLQVGAGVDENQAAELREQLRQRLARVRFFDLDEPAVTIHAVHAGDVLRAGDFEGLAVPRDPDGVLLEAVSAPLDLAVRVEGGHGAVTPPDDTWHVVRTILLPIHRVEQQLEGAGDETTLAVDLTTNGTLSATDAMSMALERLACEPGSPPGLPQDIGLEGA